MVILERTCVYSKVLNIASYRIVCIGYTPGTVTRVTGTCAQVIVFLLRDIDDVSKPHLSGLGEGLGLLWTPEGRDRKQMDWEHFPQIQGRGEQLLDHIQMSSTHVVDRSVGPGYPGG